MAMDFFQQQDRARKKTKWLVIYFALAVIGMIAAIYLAVILLFNGLHSRQHRYYSDNEQQQITYWNTEVFLSVSLVTLAIIGIGSAYKTISLAGGGSVVSEMMGGRLVASNTTDADERKLLNVIQEMSIASGVA